MGTYAEPFSIPEDIKQSHIENKHLGKHTPAQAALLQRIQDEFEKVTLQAPDWKTKNLCILARKLFQPDSHSMSLWDRYYDTAFFRCARDFRHVTKATPEGPEVVAALTKLEEYSTALEAAGVSDAAVVRYDGCCLSFIYALFWLPLASLVSLLGLGPWIFFGPYCCLAQCAVTQMT